MVAVHGWRDASRLTGPHPISFEDIPELNQVFSDAFTDRYRRDGLVGVRVPQLGDAIWRFAIRDADGGALLWRGESGEICAFNVAHTSGVEGWMGPLAVAGSYQRSGVGKTIVASAMAELKSRGATVIGLETMPRTMDNIGFYSRLGFNPGPLTITVAFDAHSSEGSYLRLSEMSAQLRDDLVRQCNALTNLLQPGYNFTREIQLTEELGLGETLLLMVGDEVAGFALCHSAPLVEGRAAEEMRVLKLACREDIPHLAMIQALTDLALAKGTRRVALRIQSDYTALYNSAIHFGGRVRWTDLRMTATGYPERRARNGVLLSNWEI